VSPLELCSAGFGRLLAILVTIASIATLRRIVAARSPVRLQEPRTGLQLSAITCVEALAAVGVLAAVLVALLAIDIVAE
jgi:hypothetical protein